MKHGTLSDLIHSPSIIVKYSTSKVGSNVDHKTFGTQCQLISPYILVKFCVVCTQPIILFRFRLGCGYFSKIQAFETVHG